jgi:catechol 2,3-dioxygenase-like lactoylglutathione lyase family enzyme
VDMKLEVAVLPVTDVDRSKAFYQGLGWRLDADIVIDERHRVVQFTRPDSPASIQFGTGTTSMKRDLGTRQPTQGRYSTRAAVNDGGNDEFER